MRESWSPGRYQMADLTDAGSAYSVVAGADAVVHTAAIPQPTGNPPHVVFQTNLMSTFNLVEAAVRFGLKRFVNVSSESIVGNFFPERPFLPDYLPMDEQHPLQPQDPYALSKSFGEQLMDAAVRRSDLRAISIRPSHRPQRGQLRVEPREAGARPFEPLGELLELHRRR